MMEFKIFSSYRNHQETRHDCLKNNKAFLTAFARSVSDNPGLSQWRLESHFSKDDNNYIKPMEILNHLKTLAKHYDILIQLDYHSVHRDDFLMTITFYHLKDAQLFKDLIEKFFVLKYNPVFEDDIDRYFDDNEDIDERHAFITKNRAKHFYKQWP